MGRLNIIQGEEYFANILHIKDYNVKVISSVRVSNPEKITIDEHYNIMIKEGNNWVYASEDYIMRFIYKNISYYKRKQSRTHYARVPK